VSYAVPAIVPAPLTYVPITLSPLSTSGSTPSAPSAPTSYALPVAAFRAQRTTGSAAQAPVRRVGRARFRYAPVAPAARIRRPEWKIVKVADGSTAAVDPNVTTWSEYRDQLATLNRGGANWVLVPAHEV